MGRIRGRSREQTRSDALVAASVTFGTYGFQGSSLAKIASAAGISAATLCHHFGDKQGLFDAVAESIYSDIDQLQTSIDPLLPLPQLVDAIYRFAEERRDSLRFMLRQVVEHGEVDPRVRQLHVGPHLDSAAVMVASRFDTTPTQARAAIVAINHLIVRFVTNSEADNAVSMASTSPAATRAAIIALLTSVARHLLDTPTDPAQRLA